MIKRILNYTFKNLTLLKEALCHSSAKKPGSSSNERLEFLGDSVLGIVISELLYKRFPHKEEGELTVIKSELVSGSVLTDLACEVKLEGRIEVGGGIKKMPESILANSLEAVFGAIYLDGGLKPIRAIIRYLFERKINEVSSRTHEVNYKATLQHYAQRKLSLMPRYRVVKESGPAHHPIFEVIARLGKQGYGTGRGRTKKEAEQQAAQITLAQLRK